MKTIISIVLAGASMALAASAWADGDPIAGKKSFVICLGCHSVTPGENKVGPTLAGVYDRKAGAISDYDYTDALKNSGLTWDDETLNKFLSAPMKAVPGTKMPIAVADPTARANLIAYLKSLKGD